MFQTFNGGVVNPGQVSYLALALTASASLNWPTFATTGNVVASIIDVTSTGAYTITMPDATQAGVGSVTVIRNLSAYTITVNDYAGGNIGTIAAGVAKLIYLTDNSTTGGTWGILTYGAGTASADASALAGYGLQAITGTLNQSHPAILTSTTITISSVSLAQSYVATSGSVACNLPTSASAGPNFFFLLKNNGTGTVTITPTGGDIIDGAATVALAPNESCIVMSAGSSNYWYTVGLGRAVAFAFTQLVKNVAGAANVTLTAAECANKVITFTGVLTGNIEVYPTNTVSVYYLYNNTSGAYTLTFKTAAGLGIAVTQGTHDVAVCDSTNVYRAITNTAGVTVFAVGSASAPSVTFFGSTDSGFYLPSAGVPGVTAGGFEVMEWRSVASSVNYLQVYASATGAAVSILAAGTDGNIGITLTPKGTGVVTVSTGLTVTATLTANGNVVIGDNAADTLRMTNDTFQNTGAKNLGFNTAPYGSWYSLCYSLEMGGPGYGIYTQSDTTRLMSNVVQESGGYKYARNDYAHLLSLESGQFGVSIAASGTAGNAISFNNLLNLSTTALGITSTNGIQIDGGSGLHTQVAYFRGSSTSNFGVYCYAVDQNGANAAGNALTVARSSATGRSINAGGTINASGADYAEYETKALNCGAVAKGQIIGFNADGEVVDNWHDAISFGVKSTNPSYVGGDAWGTEDIIGKKPVKPSDEEDLSAIAKYESDLDAWNERLESARQRVDRIAYAGRCPVNVVGAKVGDYIVPVQDGDGIAGVPVTEPTFNQYRVAVGQVRAILPDGRALIAVKMG